MARVDIDLSAPDLFGNDAAEDEEEGVFQAYAVDRDETRNFSDPTRRVCIIRAYKGEGKSALLRLAATRLIEQHGPSTVIIRDSANSFAPNLTGPDFGQAVREWKRSVLGRVATAVGSRIGMAWSDDAISLVEEAERQGFKGRSIVSSIVDRLTPKVKFKEAELEVAFSKLGTPNPAAAVRRWLHGREPVWIFVDDVDQNFQNTAASKSMVASFFVACREMANLIPELRIRSAVRPNVWTTIKMEFEPLSHVEQYVTDLSWSESANRTLLAKRVEGYLSRKGQLDDLVDRLPTDQAQRERWLIAQVCEDPMEWGKANRRPPHVVLHTLSKHRPRWLIELCKVSATHAAGRGSRIIEKADILFELDAFGKRRIQDTVAEFRSQCPEVEELIAAFNREKEEYATDELLDLIQRKVLDHAQPHIAGVIATARPLDVAAFLFEIGLIFGRREYADETYQHITYSDRPSLLRARTGVDDGVRWEIHPVFRQALEIRDPYGQETKSREERLKGGVIRRRSN